jgi:pilus assembly protein CpaB
MAAEDLTNRAPAAKARKRVVRAIALFGLALLTATITALLLTRYMDARTAAARVPTTPVVAAAVDIPVATPMKAEWLTVVQWPETSRPDGAETTVDALAGRVPIVAIGKGEPILAAKLAQPGARGGLAALLPPGMRAVAVRVDDVVGVAGFIHPGDRVDVIVTMQPRSNEPTSKVILQNVKVLAVGKEVEYSAANPSKATTATVATLMVSPEESESLALGANKGKLLLALRGIGDADVAETDGITAPVLFATAAATAPSSPPKAAGSPRARKSAPRPAEPTPQKQTVEILRGDLFEKRDFAKVEGL